VLYLHEPACRNFLYRSAVSRVNRKRPVAAEDVLRYPRIVELAAGAGLHCVVRFAPTTTYRRPKGVLYDQTLQGLPSLCRAKTRNWDLAWALCGSRPPVSTVVVG